MPDNIALLPATLASLVLESTFFGTFLLLSATSFWILFHRNRLMGVSSASSGGGRAWAILRSPYFFGTVGLTTFITGHWVMSVYRCFQGFIFFEGGTFPLGFFGNLGHFSETVKNSFFVANIITGDALIIHRLWTVWGFDRRVIIFPLCSIVGLMVCSGQLVYQLSKFVPTEPIFQSAAGRWVRTDTILTLITNTYCTSLISYRLWNTLRSEIRPHGGASLQHVLHIVIESAALYTSWNLMFYISYESQSNLQFVFIDCWPAITGICFTLIHARVGWDAIKRNHGMMTTSRSGRTEGTDVVSRPLHFNSTPRGAVSVSVGLVTSQGTSDESRTGGALSETEDGAGEIEMKTVAEKQGEVV